MVINDVNIDQVYSLEYKKVSRSVVIGDYFISHNTYFPMETQSLRWNPQYLIRLPSHKFWSGEKINDFFFFSCIFLTIELIQ